MVLARAPRALEGAGCDVAGGALSTTTVFRIRVFALVIRRGVDSCCGGVGGMPFSISFTSWPRVLGIVD